SSAPGRSPSAKAGLSRSGRRGRGNGRTTSLDNAVGPLLERRWLLAWRRALARHTSSVPATRLASTRHSYLRLFASVASGATSAAIPSMLRKFPGQCPPCSGSLGERDRAPLRRFSLDDVVGS